MQWEVFGRCLPTKMQQLRVPPKVTSAEKMAFATRKNVTLNAPEERSVASGIALIPTVPNQAGCVVPSRFVGVESASKTHVLEFSANPISSVAMANAASLAQGSSAPLAKDAPTVNAKKTHAQEKPVDKDMFATKENVSLLLVLRNLVGTVFVATTACAFRIIVQL